MLEKLKKLIGIAAEDTEKDETLNLILEFTKQRLQVKLGGVEPPASLEYIIIEVAIIRFNRIGSEGLASHSVDGESLTFSDKDFDGFTDEIQDWLDSQKESTKGKVRFI
jgi:hypothetical protein